MKETIVNYVYKLKTIGLSITDIKRVCDGYMSLYLDWKYDDIRQRIIVDYHETITEKDITENIQTVQKKINELYEFNINLRLLGVVQ